MAISVLIADDHDVIRSGVEVLLESSHFRVVASAANVAQLVRLARKHKPDVLLLDVRLGDEDGLDAIRRVRSAAPKTRIVIFSAFDNPTYVARAVAAGANDYLLKTADRDTLLAALDNAVADGPPTRTGMLRSVAASMTKQDVPGDANVPLTPRELQTLRLIAMGLSNREIADTMGISIETVKEHVQNMLRKTSLHDRTQAAVWALRNGLA
ncbi:MAG TPA: DNA-binding response regulator [Planctomycetaceae bacterium]|jgi:DNA-binding NarL/FixJ family response regulator|nr:DNA-binding response regulator [Planctomycetaceae bacterium]